MAKSLFDPPEQEELSFDNIGPSEEELFAPPKEEFGSIRSFMRGAGQGVSLGFADEMAGFVSNPVGAVKSSVGGDDDDKDVREYRISRDTSRELNKQAQEQNPGSYIGGELTGAVGSFVLPGSALIRTGKVLSTIPKMANAAKSLLKTGEIFKSMEGLSSAKSLAAVGGVAGYGGSEADDIKGQLGDVALGASVGGILPAAIKGLGRTVKKGVSAITGSEEGRTLAKIKSLQENVLLNTDKAVSKLDKEKLDLTTKAKNLIDNLRSDTQKQRKEILNSIDVEIDIAPKIKEAYDELYELSQYTHLAKDARPFLKDFNKYLTTNAKLKPEQIDKFSKIIGDSAYKQGVDPALTSALSKLSSNLKSTVLENAPIQEQKKILSNLYKIEDIFGKDIDNNKLNKLFSNVGGSGTGSEISRNNLNFIRDTLNQSKPGLGDQFLDLSKQAALNTRAQKAVLAPISFLPKSIIKKGAAYSAGLAGVIESKLPKSIKGLIQKEPTAPIMEASPSSFQSLAKDAMPDIQLPTEQLDNMKLYLSKDLQGGFALDKGKVSNVFSKTPNQKEDLMKSAKAIGAEVPNQSPIDLIKQPARVAALEREDAPKRSILSRRLKHMMAKTNDPKTQESLRNLSELPEDKQAQEIFLLQQENPKFREDYKKLEGK